MWSTYLAHHDTTHGDKWCGGETPLFGTQKTCNSDVTTCADLTIRLDNHTTTKVIENQGLMSLSKTELPRQTSVFDTSPSRSTSATIMSGDQDVVSLSLGNTRCNDTNTSF